MTEFSWSKHGDDWVVRAWDAGDAKTGDTVTVSKRSGEAKQVTLGEVLSMDRKVTFFAIAKKPDEEATVSEPGIYESPDGAVIRVQLNQEKTSVYAKRLVKLRDTQVDRVNEEGKVARHRYEYEGGLIREVKAEWRVSYERAKELSIKYGICIRCGAHLEAKKSVEEGIGPVCRKHLGG